VTRGRDAPEIAPRERRASSVGFMVRERGREEAGSGAHLSSYGLMEAVKTGDSLEPQPCAPDNWRTARGGSGSSGGRRPSIAGPTP